MQQYYIVTFNYAIKKEIADQKFLKLRRMMYLQEGKVECSFSAVDKNAF